MLVYNSGHSFDLAESTSFKEHVDLALHDFFISNFTSSSTREAYFYDIKKYYLFLDSINCSILEATSKEVSSFRDKLSVKYKVSTVRRIISALKSFYSYILDRNLILSNPADSVKLPKHIYDEGVTLSIDDDIIKRVFNTLDDSVYKELRDKTIMSILYSCCSRINSVLNLKFDDLNFDTKGLYICFTEKGGKKKLVPASEQLTIIIEKYLSSVSFDSGFIFRSCRKGTKVNVKETPPHRNNINSNIKSYFSKLGYNFKVSSHCFRKSGATRAYQNSVPLLDIKKLLLVCL